MSEQSTVIRDKIKRAIREQDFTTLRLLMSKPETVHALPPTKYNELQLAVLRLNYGKTSLRKSALRDLEALSISI